MKKAYKLTCPNCGADLELTTDKDFCFCSFCGSRIMIDDGVQRTEYTKNVNYHKTYTDEARMQEAQSKENINIQKMAFEERQDKRNNRSLLFIFLLWFGILLVVYLAVTIKDTPKKNEVKINTTYKEYRGENYNQVISELENNGFSNIECIEQKDLVTGWLKDDGDVEKVTINGNSKFEKGDIFPKDAKIIITYHTFKDDE